MSKTIKLEIGTVTLPNGSKQEVTTLDFIRRILESPTEAGLGVKTIRGILSAFDTIEELPIDATEIVFTDSEFVALQEMSANVRWVAMSPVIRNLVRALLPVDAAITDEYVPPITPDKTFREMKAVKVD